MWRAHCSVAIVLPVLLARTVPFGIWSLFFPLKHMGDFVHDQDGDVSDIDEIVSKWTGRPPLLTRGTVQIFRHDWSLDSSRSIAELSHRIRPLKEGLSTVLEAEIRG